MTLLKKSPLQESYNKKYSVGVITRRTKDGYIGVPHEYITYLESLNIYPVMLTMPLVDNVKRNIDFNLLKQVLKPLDAVLFIGGPDVINASAVTFKTGAPEIYLQMWDSIYSFLEEEGIPSIHTCRGFQSYIQYKGGLLRQHLYEPLNRLEWIRFEMESLPSKVPPGDYMLDPARPHKTLSNFSTATTIEDGTTSAKYVNSYNGSKSKGAFWAKLSCRHHQWVAFDKYWPNDLMPFAYLGGNRSLTTQSLYQPRFNDFGQEYSPHVVNTGPTYGNRCIQAFISADGLRLGSQFHPETTLDGFWGGIIKTFLEGVYRPS